MIREPKDFVSDPFRNLTNREVEVLRLLAEDRNNAEIAEILVVSDKTVRNYISTLLDKLTVDNRTEAANFAMQHNIAHYKRGE